MLPKGEASTLPEGTANGLPEGRQSHFPGNGKWTSRGTTNALPQGRQIDFQGNGNKSTGKQVLFHLKTRAFDTVLLREEIQRGGDLNN